MSDYIETHRVQAYRSGIQILHQQDMSRFQGKTRQETATGKIAFFDQVGKTSLVAKASRHAPTQQVPVETARRAVVFYYREAAEFIDRNDITTVINNPMGAIARTQAAAVAREHDQFVADAFFANAKTGEDGATSTAFPTSTHQIVHGSAGLTTGKVIDAKKILDAFEVDRTQPRYAACTSIQLNTDLLNDAQARNSDYNTVKALVTGEVNTWVGLLASIRGHAGVGWRAFVRLLRARLDDVRRAGSHGQGRSAPDQLVHVAGVHLGRDGRDPHGRARRRRGAVPGVALGF